MEMRMEEDAEVEGKGGKTLRVRKMLISIKGGKTKCEKKTGKWTKYDEEERDKTKHNGEKTNCVGVMRICNLEASKT